MRRNNMIVALLSGAVSLAATNLKAQGANETLQPPSRPQTSQTGQNPKAFEPGHSPVGASDLRASSIIGLGVFTDSGVRLGKVGDLIVNMDSRSAPYAIVEYGGTLGIGETRVAVSLADLKWSSEARQFILPTTKEQFLEANTAPTGAWMAVTGEDWTKNVDRYYGQPSQTGSSRFERQAMSGLSEGREAVRDPSELKGASGLESPPLGTELGATNMIDKPTDEALTTKVNELIHQEAGDQAGQIQASISKGVVTLTGAVASEEQKKALVHKIMELPGVARVEDKLTGGN